ncbi:MAG: ribosome maturation factor RimP [Bacillota bacterium]|nr:ribosome maturation factor RimP [Bacillota bacterium]
MARKKVTAVAEELLQPFLEREGYELYHTEFVKEGSDWFLRIYIDRPGEAGEEVRIGTGDCEKVSRFLSEALDVADPVDQNYYLEVSSPGMDRPLIRPEHYRRALGKAVDIRLYRGKEGKKNITGLLENFSGKEIVLTDEDGKRWKLELTEIAKARLAVVL